MAFETIETDPQPHPFPYWTSIIVAGSFLIIVLVLAYFQKPIQAWWKNWQANRNTTEIVELPPLLVAQPAITPTATPLALPTAIPVAIATPSMYQAPATVPSNSRLPKSGSDTLIISLFATVGAAGGSSTLYYTYQRRRLQATLRKLDILSN